MMSSPTGPAGAVTNDSGATVAERGGTRRGGMHLEAQNDFSTLAWVKPQIDELLTDARQSLEEHVEDPGDTSLLEACAMRVHQATATLRMVELFGAARLGAEMETLIDQLTAGHVADTETAFGALMRGLVQVPDYLDVIESGHKDLAIVLLPLLNELREARGAGPATAEDVFQPVLDRPLPADAAGARAALPFSDLRKHCRQVQASMQPEIAKWGEGGSVDFGVLLAGMDELRSISHGEPARRLWWAAGAVLEALKDGRMDAGKFELARRFAEVDRLVGSVADEGEEVCNEPDARECLRGLLYVVSQIAPRSGRAVAVGKAFAFERMLPTELELEHARAAMSGRNRALLDTVAKAVREDLLRVKEGLDIFLRREHRDPAELAPHVEVLQRVGETLSMLGMADAAQRIEGERKAVADMAAGKREARPESVLDIASSLLYVDASLDEHIEQLGNANAAGEGAGLPAAESRKILRTLMHEAAVNFAKVKDAVTAFVESSWSHDRLVDVPQWLGEVGGALRILELQRPVGLLDGIDRYIHNELLVDRTVPTVRDMDAFADGIASFEYYLEVGRDSGASDERVLDAVQHSLEKLGYWPVPPSREAAPATVAPSAKAPATAASVAPTVEPEVPVAADALGEVQVVDIPATQQGAPAPVGAAERAAPVVPGVGPGKWVDVEEEVVEPVSGEAPVVDASFQDAEGIDDEIREVFVEEVGEEINNIAANFPAWKSNPEDFDALKNVRRSFHTLKGSGRLVGATALGEFSWKVENMLNRVLDHTIAPDANVQELVGFAVATVPKLKSGLEGQPVQIDPPLDAIMQAADQLASGQPARVADFMQGYHKVVRTVRRWVPLAEVEHAPEPAPEPVPQTAAGGAGLPTVDPVLLEVLRGEVAQHLETMRAYLARDAAFDAPVDDELVRAVHTLHGAVGMVGLDSLTDALAPMEVWVRRVRSADAPLDREGCDALRDGVNLTEHTIAQFGAPVPDVPDSTALSERLGNLRDQWPEAKPIGAVPAGDEQERLAAEQAEQERVSAEKAEQERVAAEKAEQERVAAEKAEQERLAAEQVEQERVAAEKAEQERLAAEQVEQERLAAEKAEQERLAAEKAEQERLAAEQAEQERVAAEKAEQERLAAEQERLAAEKAEQERVAAEKVEQERVAAEKAEQERLAAEKAEQERVAAEKAEQERLAAEKAEQERVAAEKAEQERVAAEKAEEERVAAEQAEQERLAAEKAELERIVVRRAEAERELAKEALPPFPDDVQPEGELDKSKYDPELVGLFAEEGHELLDASDGLLAQLRQAPDDADSIHGLQRNLHTIKGGARVVGISAAGDLAHAMETLLEHIGDHKRGVQPIEQDSLERGFDRLNELVRRVEAGQAVATPVHAVARFNALAAGEAIVAAPAGEVPAKQVTPEPVVAEEPVAAEAAATTTAEVPPAPVVVAPREAPKLAEVETHAPTELIRVRSDLLDSMVNAAGEVSIYRSRLEQQVSNFRFNLEELGQTVTRLREQLRKLEIETETQILSRYQRENEGAEGTTFDPLELDRFSNLQQYSRALAESVSDLASIQDILDDQTRQSETLLLQQSRVNSDLQDGLMRTRMVPFESLVPNLRRTLRGAADELGKRAQLRVEGAQGEMDRNVLERMKAPFEHMLRNALTHGIEAPAQRVAVGKPADGTVAIRVRREGTEVLVDVADDGAGFDRDAIRAKAIERGLLKADAKVTDDELYQFVLQTGFSTAGEVSQLAGRGVGMDVVANEVRDLGGSLTIESNRGHGTTFHIRLPFTLAVTRAITVRVGDASFAVPMTAIQSVARLPRADMERHLAEGNGHVEYAGESYQLFDLSRMLGLPQSPLVEDTAGQVPLLVVRSGDLRGAVRIDSIVGSSEIVVKPVGPQISNVPGMFGATILGDGSVMLILELAPLVRRRIAKLAELAAVQALPEDERAAAEAEAAQPVAPAVEEARPWRVMVVDDSITMRKVTTRVLEREQMEVVTAKDGVDALEKLQDVIPDVMLLDIEMPRMDGFELATHMKNDARFRRVPIIMITSRTGEKHRERAFGIGVDRYLGKPYSEADLLHNIGELVGVRHG